MKRMTCKSFDYSPYKATIYDEEHTVKYNNYVGSKKIPVSYEPIRVMIAFTPGKALGRPPVFISRGRRITEISDIKSFSSDRKREIWRHPNITGYIDLKTLLSPTIARTDYRNDDTSRRIFGYIKNILEPQLLAFITQNVKKYNKNDFSRLEQRINEEFREISNRKYADASVLKKEDLVELDDDMSSPLYEVSIPRNNFTPNFSGSITGWNKQKRKRTIHSQIKPPRNNSALDLKIDAESEPIKDSEGNQKRSELFGNTVIIYKKHPDFEDRIDNSGGLDKISYELVTYIVGELLVHYTDKFFEKNGSIAYSKNAYIFLTERLYKLTSGLKDLIGKPLS